MRRLFIILASAAVLAAGAMAEADTADITAKLGGGCICIPANSIVEQVPIKANKARGEWLCVEVPDEGIFEYLTVDHWEPSEEDICALSRMAYGEARGCGERGIEAVMWCAINRLDTGRWGGTVLKVVSAPHQFYGYSAQHPVTEEIRAIAEKVLIAWHNGEERLIPSDYFYFTGNGKENIFRNEQGEKVTICP